MIGRITMPVSGPHLSSSIIPVSYPRLGCPKMLRGALLASCCIAGMQFFYAISQASMV